jgi:hypothetical protein
MDSSERKLGKKGDFTMTDDLRYPIGKFQWDGEFSAARKAAWIEQVAVAPKYLREAVAGLSDDQLDTPYRDGGWTLRQVVHHVPDSHMNANIRFKLALTEDTPTIKTYHENLWAQLEDSHIVPVEVSLVLLDSLHTRWVALMESMSLEDFDKEIMHPEMGKLSLAMVLGIYAWHGRHHVAHIASLRDRNGW